MEDAGGEAEDPMLLWSSEEVSETEESEPSDVFVFFFVDGGLSKFCTLCEDWLKIRLPTSCTR